MQNVTVWANVSKRRGGPHSSPRIPEQTLRDQAIPCEQNLISVDNFVHNMTTAQ
jgi:hypothetical protein